MATVKDPATIMQVRKPGTPWVSCDEPDLRLVIMHDFFADGAWVREEIELHGHATLADLGRRVVGLVGGEALELELLLLHTALRPGEAAALHTHDQGARLRAVGLSQGALVYAEMTGRSRSRGVVAIEGDHEREFSVVIAQDVLQKSVLCLLLFSCVFCLLCPMHPTAIRYLISRGAGWWRGCKSERERGG